MEVSVGSVTSKGQVTIPKEVRDKLGLRSGDKVVFSIENGEATIRKVKQERLTTLLGRQEAWEEESVGFQRRLRKEWASRQY
ncbi:MAG TPA: AbrB/MazE/SpoVT family DNA-binding domain-containing protein [Nitrososphaerales archaeon]|nr:AbrB/MazE/SpoVT family DNA-binding domain-containing protein [Nitrososphaerales archaeon]